MDVNELLAEALKPVVNAMVESLAAYTDAVASATQGTLIEAGYVPTSSVLKVIDDIALEFAKADAGNEDVSNVLLYVKEKVRGDLRV